MSPFENEEYIPGEESSAGGMAPQESPEETPVPVCDGQESVHPEEEPTAPEAASEPQPQPDAAPRREAAPYHGRGAGRKESPYANSPYVMEHQQAGADHAAYDQSRRAATAKPKKQHKKRFPGFWKKAVAALLAAAMVAGACAFTASVVNNRWEDRMYETEKYFDGRIRELQNQIDNASQKAAVGAVLPGEAMLPSQVYAANVNSVVAISCTVTSGGFYGTTEGTSAGSGFILTENGYVITNCHVVEGASAVYVITHDGTQYEASVEGADSSNDVAVLKIEAEGLTPVTIGSSSDLAIGDMVVAIGNPLGTLSSTQTVGYVSGKDRDVTTDGTIISMIQTDAAINSGNSGGPLFNMKGEVVGITTAKYSGTSGSGATIEGLGFAIPIDDVHGIITDLMDYGYVTGAYLGITVTDTDEESASMYGLPTGAYVMSVEKGYAAERAGIRAKDIIIDLGGHKVTGITSLTRALRNFKAGDTTTVTVVRSGGELRLEITLDEKPQSLNTTPSQPTEEGMPSEGNAEEWYDYYFRHFFGD